MLRSNWPRVMYEAFPTHLYYFISNRTIQCTCKSPIASCMAPGACVCNTYPSHPWDSAMRFLPLVFVIGNPIPVLATPVPEENSLFLPKDFSLPTSSPFTDDQTEENTLPVQVAIEDPSNSFNPWTSSDNPFRSTIWANSAQSPCRSKTNSKFRLRDTGAPAADQLCKSPLQEDPTGTQEPLPEPNVEPARKPPEYPFAPVGTPPVTGFQGMLVKMNNALGRYDKNRCKIYPFNIRLYCDGPVGNTILANIPWLNGLTAVAVWYESVEGCNSCTYT